MDVLIVLSNWGSGDVGDVNGDGRPDFTLGAKGKPFDNGNYFAVFYAPEDPAKPSRREFLPDAGMQTGATHAAPADVNGDGKVDVIASRGHGLPARHGGRPLALLQPPEHVLPAETGWRRLGARRGETRAAADVWSPEMAKTSGSKRPPNFSARTAGVPAARELGSPYDVPAQDSVMESPISSSGSLVFAGR